MSSRRETLTGWETCPYVSSTGDPDVHETIGPEDRYRDTKFRLRTLSFHFEERHLGKPFGKLELVIRSFVSFVSETLMCLETI